MSRRDIPLILTPPRPSPLTGRESYTQQRGIFSRRIPERHVEVRWLAVLLLAITLAACGDLAPADAPPQLTHTPGPAVTISDGRYVSESFTAEIPDGWQIVTSPAFAAPWVVFSSPDDDAVIMVAMDRDDTETVQPGVINGELVWELVTVGLADGEVAYAVLVTGGDDADSYRPAFERVAASVQPG